MGQFCEVEDLEYDKARSHLMDLLGVDRAKASTEMKKSRGPKVRLSWLREVYHDCIQHELWECAARAYLLHLLGCTIFTNKSGTLICVSYLILLRDLNACSRYAWGAAALAHTYEQLGDASFYGVRQIAGYATLLQSWICEHLPEMGRRRVLDTYTDLHPKLHDTYLRDKVRVLWRGVDIWMGSRWIRLGNMIHRHLPERVLRQFGFVHIIPRSPESLPMADIHTIDLHWLRYVDHAFIGVVEAEDPSTCVDEYLVWFRRVSHLYITPGDDDDRPSLAPRMRVVARRSVEEYEDATTSRGARHLRGRASFS
ncbi:protein MAIN-LIKE 1-like [Vigna radiata var. radiata]|uniref:Protein MAIN-LIKE 1-like n=1 Tax=Vigna radiata var. radiata TaxID=3916 RepID=A0A1S3VGZ6_VIGRR|nr:protein MAIN-LIKE 1-like [Vigna radiata var. radiata]